MARNRYLDDEEQKLKLDNKLAFRLFAFLKPFRWPLLGLLLVTLLCVALSLAQPQVVRLILDVAFVENDLGLGLRIVGMLLLCAVAENLLNAFRSVHLSRIGQKVVHNIRETLFHHLLSLSFRFFDERPAGKILVRVTSYIDNLAGLVSTGFVQLLGDVVTLVGIIAVMLIMNARLAFICFAAVVPLFFFMFIFRKLLSKQTVKVRNKTSNRTAYTHENIMGSMTIQAFGLQENNVAELHRLNMDIKSTWKKWLMINGSLWPMIDLFSCAAVFAVYLLGYQYYRAGVMGAGELAAFALYVGRFWQPINSISMYYNQIVNSMSNLEKIFETLDTKPLIANAPGAQPLPEIKGKVEFDGVTFGYEDGQEVLKDVSFTIPAGQTVALVGPTGSGKTTVINLVARFYDPTGGTVKIDGQDIRTVTLESLHSQIGIMLQDSFIFTGTILENIRYGKPGATEEECREAAEKVAAHSFISALPEGYNTRTEERGAGLSSGQRQLISFARVLLANPRILILDEATSAVDTHTEQLIQKALDVVLAGRTSFVVAHRLSTIQNADVIFCIQNKGIAEAGTHSQLMAKQGIYYNLQTSQQQEKQ